MQNRSHIAPVGAGSRMTLADKERFNSKIDKSGECWIWKGATGRGYGHFLINGKHVLTHRLAYELAYGAIPEGLHVCHHCDVRACCNPAHLFAGTRRDNMRDMVRKGRGVPNPMPGEKNPNSKLTMSLIEIIRARYASGEFQREIAASLGVSQSLVSLVLSGKRWKCASQTQSQDKENTHASAA